MKKKKSELVLLTRRFGSIPLMSGFLIAAILRTFRDLGCMITLANATNAVLTQTNVIPALGWMMVAMFAQCPLCAMENYFASRYESNFQHDGMEALGEKLPRLPLAWFGKQKTGSVLSTCTNDMDKVINFSQYAFSTLIRQIVYYIGGIAYCLSQNVALTCIIFPVVICLMPIFNQITKPLKELSKKQRTSAAKTLSEMQEVLADPEFIKAYSLEETMEQRVDRALTAQMQSEQKGSIFQTLSQAAGILSGYLPGFISAAAGIYFLLRGEVTAGFMVSFVQICVQRFSGVLPQFSYVISSYHQATASAERLLEILDAEEEQKGGEKSLPALPDVPIFEAKNLSFRYTEESDLILDGVSIEVHKGETVALVGGSGGGKSTLLSLLMGVHLPEQGELFCMGRRIGDWDPAFLREQIAPVFQDAFLFPTSIRENICGTEKGKEETEKVWDALQNAGLGDFVAGLSTNIDTEIGERGTSLSGGQRQRMTIARAFYKDAPIVLFDEPTSALDTVTEDQFQTVYRELKKGRTTIVVAHRLKTIRDADRIYVLEHGKVVQTGCHDALIAEPGAYRRLYEAQAALEEVV